MADTTAQIIGTGAQTACAPRKEGERLRAEGQVLGGLGQAVNDAGEVFVILSIGNGDSVARVYRP